ncbi:MAG TPA: N-acetylmuramoyl-L-alanine amidase [Allosphingosinicella sp.]|nr:N-acetylmuramoyl-L-alanine amidase [Allosphingosinicella sp.]
MALNIIQDFIPTSLPTRPQIKITPGFITIHNTDNTGKGAGAAAHNKYVRGADAVKRKVSWHYTADDKAVYQHLPTGELGFHAGTPEGNRLSIGIEICMNSDMNVAAGYARAAALVAHCVKQLGLSFPKCMKQHHDWSGKNCPSAIRAAKSMSWQQFLSLCQAEISKPAPKGLAAAPQVTIVEEAPDWSPKDEEAILRSIDESMADHGGDDPDS